MIRSPAAAPRTEGGSTPECSAWATISNCTGVEDINITFGWIGPTPPATPQGTIVFFSGGSGTEPTENGDDIPAYAPIYVNNFVIVYVEYMGFAWEDPNNGGGGSILLAACRPATFLKYIHDNAVIHQGAMCAQGFSAGSAALAYSMSWYGSAQYLKNAEFLAGPVFSKIGEGCSTTAPTLDICDSSGYCTAHTQSWFDSEIYKYPNNIAVSTWTGLPPSGSNSGACATSGGSIYIPQWQQMGIVDGTSGTVTPVFSFPQGREAWLAL